MQCHMSNVSCHMSRVICRLSLVKKISSSFFQFFFRQSGEAYRWRVCYHWGLPRQVFFKKGQLAGTINKKNLKKRHWLATLHCDKNRSHPTQIQVLYWDKSKSDPATNPSAKLEQIPWWDKGGRWGPEQGSCAEATNNPQTFVCLFLHTRNYHFRNKLWK